MRKVRKIILVLLAIMCVGLFCSCREKSFTKEQLKEKNNELVPLAEKWFSDNRPDAKFGKAEVYSDGIDLMNAVKGLYSVGKTEYSFIYDASSECMYIEEGYEEAVTLIASDAAKKLGTDLNHIMYYFYNSGFVSTFAIEPKISTDPLVKYEKMIPADITPEKFAEEVINGERKLEYNIRVYDESIHENARVIYDSLPNLLSLTFIVKADWEYSGISSVSYSSVNTEYYYSYITKLDDDFYGGYVYITECMPYEEYVMPTDLSAPVFSKTGDKEMTLKVPYGATPIIFTSRSIKPVLHYTLNDNKLENELDDCDKNINSIYYGNENIYTGFDNIFGIDIGTLMMPESKMNCFYVYFSPNMYFDEYVISY